METRTKLSVFFVVVWLLTGNLTINAQSVNDAAPDFELKDLNGNTFKLSDQSGKVVFIFFFGYGCPHCHTNAPNTQTGLYKYFMGRNDFVAIGIDTWDGTSQQVTDFKSTTGVEYIMLLKGSKIASSFASTYDRILVIDQQGIIQYKSTDYATEQVTAEAKTVIEGLLEGQHTSGINQQQSENPVQVFPNPASEYFFVNNPFKNAAYIQVSVIDIAGKELISELHDFNVRENIPVLVSDLSQGVYLVKLESPSGETVVKKLIKK